MPFSHHTIPEYFLELMLFGVGCNYYVAIPVLLCTFFMSCHLLIEAGCVHLQRYFCEIDELAPPNVKLKSSKLCKIRLVDAIKHHIKLREYLLYFIRK